MALKREIKDAYIEKGASIYVKTHSNAVYVDENETETLTKRLDNVKKSITEHTSQLDKKANYNNLYENKDLAIAIGYSSKKGIGLYVTFDGKNIARVCDLDFPSNKWDIGLTYLNGYFYICYDYRDMNYNGYEGLNQSYFLGGNKIGCSRTKDFINF